MGCCLDVHLVIFLSQKSISMNFRYNNPGFPSLSTPFPDFSMTNVYALLLSIQWKLLEMLLVIDI